VFQKALKVGKVIRNQEGWERGGPTLYGALWQLAEWKRKKILLVGYSEINRGFASFLMHKGVERFSLCTRSPARVDLEGVHVYDRSVLSRWQEYDILVCASQAERFLIEGPSEKRHCIFDLSVPRNVDPEVGQVATLYNIDQLIERKKEARLDPCEELLWEHVVRLTHIYRAKIRRAQGIEETGLRLVYSPSL
jgi:glutamyl-tRNA reductase